MTTDTKKGGPEPAEQTTHDGFATVHPAKTSRAFAATYIAANTNRTHCSIEPSHNAYLDPNSLAPWLPHFEEGTSDIPSGYGIEHSHDGGFYPYEINVADIRQIAHLKDSDGLDRRCASRDEALSAITEEVVHADD